MIYHFGTTYKKKLCKFKHYITKKKKKRVFLAGAAAPSPPPPPPAMYGPELTSGINQWLEKMNSDDNLDDLESAEASQPLMKRKQTFKGKEYQTQLYQDQRSSGLLRKLRPPKIKT